MNQPYNFAYLLHPSFGAQPNCAGTTGLFSKQRPKTVVATTVCTPCKPHHFQHSDDWKLFHLTFTNKDFINRASHPDALKRGAHGEQLILFKNK